MNIGDTFVVLGVRHLIPVYFIVSGKVSRPNATPQNYHQQKQQKQQQQQQSTPSPVQLYPKRSARPMPADLTRSASMGFLNQVTRFRAWTAVHLLIRELYRFVSSQVTRMVNRDRNLVPRSLPQHRTARCCGIRAFRNRLRLVPSLALLRQ